MKMHRRRRQSDPCNCLRPFIRILGIITSIVCCGVGVDIQAHGFKSGSFIIVGSTFVLFLETKWIITLFLQLILASEYICCWSKICKIFGGWRLALPYVMFGVALMVWPHKLWLSYVSGSLLLFLAVSRLFTLIQFSGNFKGGEELLHQKDDFYEKSGMITADIMNDSYSICHSLDDEDPIEPIEEDA